MHESITTYKAQIDNLRRERGNTDRMLFDAAVLNRPRASICGTIGMVQSVDESFDDFSLISRLVRSFNVTKSLPLGDSSNFWLNSIAGMQKREFDIISDGNVEAVAELFHNPQFTQLFVGFDDVMANNPYTPHISDAGFQEWSRQWAYDSLVSIAEAVGTIRIESVEARQIRSIGVEEILSGLDDAFGFQITFPNINRGEIGLVTSRGIASFRAIQSLFQGWRIASLLRETDGCRVVEIGGGLGRTCYYAKQFGVSYYDIVDLPLTSACQAYHLGRILGDDQVALHGEVGDAPVRLMPPSVFLSTAEPYDLAVNVDSFPEMSGDTIAEYWNRIKHTAPMLLSINHEGSLNIVNYFIKTTNGASFTRNRYWLRRGYVEEVIRFQNSSSL